MYYIMIRTKKINLIGRITMSTLSAVSTLAVNLIVTNAPSFDYLAIGDEMSDGVVINSSNQYDYTARYKHAEDDMTGSNLDVDFMSLSAIGDGTGILSIIKEFKEDVSYDTSHPLLLEEALFN